MSRLNQPLTARIGPRTSPGKARLREPSVPSRGFYRSSLKSPYAPNLNRTRKPSADELPQENPPSLLARLDMSPEVPLIDRISPAKTDDASHSDTRATLTNLEDIQMNMDIESPHNEDSEEDASEPTLNTIPLQNDPIIAVRTSP